MIRVELDRAYYSDYFYKIFKNQLPRLDKGYTIDDWLVGKILTGEMYEWCEKNTVGLWKFYIHNSFIMEFYLDYFYFSFEKEEDAVAFKIRWL